MLTGPRADVDHPVGLADRLLVMLDDDERVAHVSQPHEGVDETAVVALVQPDGRLVEHVEHTHQARADLGGQPDPLGLTARQRPRRARQGEVVQADVDEETQPGSYLLDHSRRDHGVALAEGEGVEEFRRLAHRQVGDIGDGVPVHRHRQAGRFEAFAVAYRTGMFAQVLPPPRPGRVCLGLVVTTTHVVQHALVVLREGTHPSEPVAVGHHDRIAVTLQDELPHLFRQLGPRQGRVEVVIGTQPLEDVSEVSGHLGGRPRRYGPVHQTHLGIGDDELRVDVLGRSQPGAHRAGTPRAVERELPRLQLIHLDVVAIGAGQILREPPFPVRGVLGTIDEIDGDNATRQPHGGLHRLGEPLFDRGFDDEPVDDHVDVVLALLVQDRNLAQPVHRAVHPHTGETVGGELAEQFDVLPLAATYHWGEHLELGALVNGEQPVDDLLWRLLGDGFTTDRTVRHTDARPQQTQVVVDLGDGAHRGTRVARGRLLVDGHRRGQPLDEVDVGLVHLAEELTCICRQGLDVATLPLGEDRVKGQG